METIDFNMRNGAPSDEFGENLCSPMFIKRHLNPLANLTQLLSDCWSMPSDKIVFRADVHSHVITFFSN